MKHVHYRSSHHLILAVIVVVFALLLGVLWRAERTNERRYNQLLSQAISQEGRIAALSGFANYNHGVVSVEQGKVYLPSLHLALPLTDTTATLMYGLRTLQNTAANEADVTTQAAAAFVPDNAPVRDCSSLVRIKFEAKPNTYNPEEKSAASVNLSDGRVLQVYSFHLKSCDLEYKLTNANSDALAATFKEATAY